MGFSLLAPLFLAGLAAVAVPILVHLSARDRRGRAGGPEPPAAPGARRLRPSSTDVLRFPSLKFLTRLPYRQAKRQRLRHRSLFALRTLALILLVLAFTRPLFDGAAALAGSGREVAIALDRSYSMTRSGTWERAIEAARAAVSGAPAGSRLSLISFAEEARVEVAPTTDRQAVLEALERLAPGSGSTRFAPALRQADEILLDSVFAERQVVLVSDLQAAGWDRTADSGAAVLSPGVELDVADLASADPASNVSIAGAGVRQTRDGGGSNLRCGDRRIALGNASGDLPGRPSLPRRGRVLPGHAARRRRRAGRGQRRPGRVQPDEARRGGLRRRLDRGGYS